MGNSQKHKFLKKKGGDGENADVPVAEPIAEPVAEPVAEPIANAEAKPAKCCPCPGGEDAPAPSIANKAEEGLKGLHDNALNLFGTKTDEAAAALKEGKQNALDKLNAFVGNAPAPAPAPAPPAVAGGGRRRTQKRSRRSKRKTTKRKTTKRKRSHKKRKTNKRKRSHKH